MSIINRLWIVFCFFSIVNFLSIVNQEVFAQTGEQEIVIDAILLIDNSGSMDWKDHDPENNRFESARVFIDKSDEKDAIALVDFSGNSKLIFPLMKATSAQKSTMKNLVSTVHSDRQLTDIDSALRLALQELSSNRANPAHTPAVILLTDGEIDVVKGTEEQKRSAAKRSESLLFLETIPKYVQGYIPIYTVALGSEADASVLEKISEQTRLKDQVNEQHHYNVSSQAEIVEVFSSISSQMKKRSRVVNKHHFTGEPINQTTEATPLTNKLSVDVLLEHKKNMQVTLKDPSGKVVKPHSQGDKYNLYEIEDPAQGPWSVSVEGEGENEVIIATEVKDDIKIGMPFASRFKLGDEIPIFANVIYKDEVVDGSVIDVVLDGQKYPLTIKELILTIQKPDESKSGPFSLKRKGGSYTFFYKDADMPGNYTFNFNLKTSLMGRDSTLLGQKTVLAQKEIYVFRAVEPPTVLFKKLENEYFVGDIVLIEFLVTKNAQLMQKKSIPVKVRLPQGETESLAAPRKGLKVYSFSFPTTKQKGEYTFIVPETEEYDVENAQQTFAIVTTSVFPWKLLVAAFILFAIIGLLILGKIKGWFSREIEETPEDDTVSEDEEPAEVEEVGTGEYYPVPNEILIWDKNVLAGFIRITENSQPTEEASYFVEYSGKTDIVEGSSLSEEGIQISCDDTLVLDRFEFTIVRSEDGSINATIISHDENIAINMYDREEDIRCFILPAISEPPQKGDLISPAFLQDDTVHIGQDVGYQWSKPNEIILLDPSVNKKHAAIRIETPVVKTTGYDYFLKVLNGVVILNDNTINRGDEQPIYDGDIMKLGVFTFELIIDETDIHLSIVDCQLSIDD